MKPFAEVRVALLAEALETLYRVSHILARSLDLQSTLSEVLKALDDGGMTHGLVTLTTPEGNLRVHAVRGMLSGNAEAVRYERGEGIVGMILERGQAVVLERVSDERRFLDRLQLYDAGLPFIGVPLSLGGTLVGVLAAQPDTPADGMLDERVRLMEMVANLIGQSVRLADQVARERRDLTEERDNLRRTVRGQFGFSNIVGHAQQMQRLFDQVRQVAKWNTTVLIRGETGTGKELIAHAIHYNSPRAAGAFVKINCAALPESLLESELFGHEKGAFTGAVAQRKGRFEQADAGTLFLDEIGEVSPAFQAKLLRVLQEGELERVGGTRTIKVDVRVIAATHRDLESDVESGKFREDLYYRLNVMPIQVPALRERMEDIPEIAHFLIAKIGRGQGRELKITESALRVLQHHDWPGNVRELENCLERAAVMCDSGVIDREQILMTGVEEGMGRAISASTPTSSQTRAATSPVSSERHSSMPELDDPDMDERERVIAALEQSGWVQAKAARLLDMTPRQIAYRIKILDIKVRQF
ncbi:MAG: nif-specific transcriptional activator NifA [Halothiobacillaceae bacterium]|nr:nif-specific transcriptional activator NifA [Halothiobacillaceae bacterium]